MRSQKQEAFMKSFRIDFAKRGENGFPKISSLARRRKIRGAFFEKFGEDFLQKVERAVRPPRAFDKMGFAK